MHEGDGRLILVGQLHEVTLGSLLGGQALSEVRLLAGGLAAKKNHSDEGWEKAYAEAEKEEVH
jgi:hypothetical protein